MDRPKKIPRAIRALARRASARDGYTLLEVLVGSMMLVIALSAAMGVLEVGLRTEPKVTGQAARVGDARQLMERITRELRETYAVQATGSSELDFFTYGRPGEDPSPDQASGRHVVYQCDAGKCHRRESRANEALPGPDQAVVVLDGLKNSDVFSYQPDGINPEYVRVKLVLDVKGQNRQVTLEDGVNLRNATDYAD